MLSAACHRLRARAGFTLVELVVAMAAGMIVLMGAASLMIVVMRQSQTTFSRIDATRQGRGAIATVENELHSACVNGHPPIEGVTSGGTVESDANDLVFLSYTGPSANPTPVWHKLTFNPAAGTLTDYSYNVAGTNPDWTQGTLIGSKVLMSNVKQSGANPVFRYFAYQLAYTDGAGNKYYAIPDGINAQPVTGAPLTMTALNTAGGLSASDAQTVVEVMVSLVAGPSDPAGGTGAGASVNDTLTDAISLRLTTPPDYVASGATAVGYGPCQ